MIISIDFTKHKNRPIVKDNKAIMEAIMRDLDSYQIFCALELLKSKQMQNDRTIQNHSSDEDEVVCACAKYLNESL